MQSPSTTHPWRVVLITTHSEGAEVKTLVSNSRAAEWQTSRGYQPACYCQWITAEDQTDVPAFLSPMAYNYKSPQEPKYSHRKKAKGDQNCQIKFPPPPQAEWGSIQLWSNRVIFLTYLCGWTEIHTLGIPGRRTLNKTEGLESRAFTGNSNKFGIA